MENTTSQDAFGNMYTTYTPTISNNYSWITGDIGLGSYSAPTSEYLNALGYTDRTWMNTVPEEAYSRAANMATMLGTAANTPQGKELIQNTADQYVKSKIGEAEWANANYKDVMAHMHDTVDGEKSSPWSWITNFADKIGDFYTNKIDTNALNNAVLGTEGRAIDSIDTNEMQVPGTDTSINKSINKSIDTNELSSPELSSLTIPTIPVNQENVTAIREGLEKQANIRPRTADTYFELGENGKPKYEIHGEDVESAANNARDIIEDMETRGLLNEETADFYYDKIDEMEEGEYTDYRGLLGQLIKEKTGDESYLEANSPGYTPAPEIPVAESEETALIKKLSDLGFNITSIDYTPGEDAFPGADSFKMKDGTTVTVKDRGYTFKDKGLINPTEIEVIFGSKYDMIQVGGGKGKVYTIPKETNEEGTITIKTPDGNEAYINNGKVIEATFNSDSDKNLMKVYDRYMQSKGLEEYKVAYEKAGEEYKKEFAPTIDEGEVDSGIDSGIDDASPMLDESEAKTPAPAPAPTNTPKTATQLYEEMNDASVEDRANFAIENAEKDENIIGNVAPDVATMLLQDQTPDKWGNISNPRITSNTYELPYTEHPDAHYITEAYTEAIKNRGEFDEGTKGFEFWNEVAKNIGSWCWENGFDDVIPVLTKIDTEGGASDEVATTNFEEVFLGPGRMEEGFEWNDVMDVMSSSKALADLRDALEKGVDPSINIPYKEQVKFVVQAILKGGTGMNTDEWGDAFHRAFGDIDRELAADSKTALSDAAKGFIEDVKNAIGEGGLKGVKDGIEAVKGFIEVVSDAAKGTTAGQVAGGWKDVVKGVVTPIVMAAAIALGQPVLAAAIMMKNMGIDNLIKTIMEYNGGLTEEQARMIAEQVQSMDVSGLGLEDARVPGASTRNADTYARYDPTAKDVSHAEYNKGLTEEVYSDERMKEFISYIIPHEPILLRVVKGL